MLRSGPDILDLRSHRSNELLQEIYDGLYLASFPFPEEREDPSIWAPLLWSEDRSRGPELHFLVAGERLETPSRDVHGFAIAEYYPRSDSGLLSYIAVAPERRGTGLSRRLLGQVTEALRRDARANENSLTALFAEVHDPARVSASGDAMAPTERLAVMAALGARRVAVDYVQPELTPGAGPSRNLLLIAFPVAGPDREELSVDVVRGFLEELYRSVGIDEPSEDPDFIRMVGGLRGDALRLVPLT